MTLLWKLLRSHLSVAQTLGFVLAGVVGMAIVLGALQAYRDIVPIFNAPDSFAKGEYMVLSKRVGTLQTLGLGSSDFSDQEIAALGAEPFVEDVGRFTPAAYRIVGSVGLGNMRFSTYLFFESVPDRFLDVHTEAWNFQPGDRDIPIIIPRNYLNLYNYGFAKSQGLPQISENIFQNVALDIELSGGGHTENFRGRIVGLSNRLNTILVPQSFIEWSNAQFGGSGQKPAARIIVETSRPVDAAVEKYLAAHGYEAEGDLQDGGKAARFLRLATGGVAGLGLVFSLMSFYILMLSVFLLLQKSSEKIANLLLLGYSPRRVARPYWLLTLGLNVGVLAVSVVLVMVVRSFYLPELGLLQSGFQASSICATLWLGVGLALLLTLFNCMAISRKISVLNRRRR